MQRMIQMVEPEIEIPAEFSGDRFLKQNDVKRFDVSALRSAFASPITVLQAS